MEESTFKELGDKEEDKLLVAEALINHRRFLRDNCITGDQQKALRGIFDEIDGIDEGDPVEVLKGPQVAFDSRAKMINKIAHLVGVNVICAGDKNDEFHVQDIIKMARGIDDQQRGRFGTLAPVAPDPEFEKAVAEHIAEYVDAYLNGEYHPETQEMQDQLELIKHVMMNPRDKIAEGEAKKLIQEIAAEYKVHIDHDGADHIMTKLRVYAEMQHPEKKIFSYQKDVPLSVIRNEEGPSAPAAAPLKRSCGTCGNVEIKPTDNFCGKCGVKVA